MQTYRLKITRYISTAEEAFVEVEATSKDEAIEIANERCSAGVYDGTPSVEWEEDADHWDAHSWDIDIVEEA